MPDPAAAHLLLDPAPSATDRVFRALYDAVVSLKLPPGAKVSEAELARQMGVSRQPVRDAFFRLHSLGLLSIRPQRPTLITRISEAAVRDALFVRVALESECLRHAIARLTEAGTARLRDNLARQRAALDDARPDAFHALDEEFHAAICDLAGQAHAWGLILDQKAHMDRVRFLTLSVERRHLVLAEHAALVEAMAARDTALAEDRLRAHLDDIRRVLAAARQARPEVFEATT